MTRSSLPSDEPVEVDGPMPAPVGSPLFDLRAIRDEKLKKLYLDLPVPRWGEKGKDSSPTPRIFVRYGPVDPHFAMKAGERRRKKSDPEWLVNTAADILANACIGVYALVGDDTTKYSLRQGDPLGDWTKFDEDLGKALGATEERAVAVVKALYLTSGDIIAAAATVGEWSGVVLPQADEESLGE